MNNSNAQTDLNDTSKRKLFYGLFIFPLIIAVAMAVFLCGVVLLTSEPLSTDNLIKSLKTSSPSKRWQKAFELANELNRVSSGKINQDRLLQGQLIEILKDNKSYDDKTRGYIALALGNFKSDLVAESLYQSFILGGEDVQSYCLWSLARLEARQYAAPIANDLSKLSDNTRAVAIYVLGVLADNQTADMVKLYLSSAHNDTRWNAALTLARLGRPEAYSELKRMSNRASVMESLQQANVNQDLDKKAEQIILNAIKGMTLIPNAESITILQSISDTDPNFTIRQAAKEALMILKGKK